jgi:hypothetical protein
VEGETERRWNNVADASSSDSYDTAWRPLQQFGLPNQ